MNLVSLTATGQAITTSLIIAEGTNIEHRAVLQLTRQYLNDLEEFGRVAFEMLPFETPGGTQKREIAHYNERQATFILTLMRNSDVVVDFKKRLVKAFWHLAQQQLDAAQREVEEEVQRFRAMSKAELLIMAAESEKRCDALQMQVNTLEPKATALDRIATAKVGSMSFTEAAKALKVSRDNKLIPWLDEHEWIYRNRRGDKWLAVQAKIDAGYLEHRVNTIPVHDGQEDRIVYQVLITPKGIARLSEIFEAEKAAKMPLMPRPFEPAPLPV
jgi:phage antirepressor YoqD-like protein